MSEKSGFSTASKLAIADMRAENARKDAIRDAEMAKKDAEMEAMKAQMAEMLKMMQNVLNRKIPLKWLNSSYATYKLKCKEIFLK